PPRAIQSTHWTRRARYRIPKPAGKRAPVLRQRSVAGRLEHSGIPAAGIQAPDDFVRLHGRPAPLRLSRRAVGEATARPQRRGCRAAPPRTGEQAGMKAMILAAGLGTRLRPLTDDRPKALVEIAGRTLLEITLARLRTFGIHEVIINVHHFAGKVVDYLRAQRD